MRYLFTTLISRGCLKVYDGETNSEVYRNHHKPRKKYALCCSKRDDKASTLQYGLFLNFCRSWYRKN